MYLSDLSSVYVLILKMDKEATESFVPMADEESAIDDHAFTITLALDVDGPTDELADADLLEFIQIRPPMKPKDIVAGLHPRFERVPLGRLPVRLVRLFERRLNSPVLGSMRNWEFIAAHLGLCLRVCFMHIPDTVCAKVL